MIGKFGILLTILILVLFFFLVISLGAGAFSKGDIGPNLNLIKPSLETVIMAVTNGIGVMPAYDGILSSSEIKAVAKYVSEKSN